MLTACHAQLRFRDPFWVRSLRVRVRVKVRVRVRVGVRLRVRVRVSVNCMPCTAEV